MRLLLTRFHAACLPRRELELLRALLIVLLARLSCRDVDRLTILESLKSIETELGRRRRRP